MFGGAGDAVIDARLLPALAEGDPYGQGPAPRRPVNVVPIHEQAGRVPPQAVDVEQSVLGAMLIEREAIPRLRRYAGFFTASMREGMMPLCGALSAETAALPLAMQQRVRHFFELHLAWLRTVLKEGVKAGELGPDLDVGETASLVLSALEGASLVAWALKDASVITPAFEQVVSGLIHATSTNNPTRE